MRTQRGFLYVNWRKNNCFIPTLRRKNLKNSISQKYLKGFFTVLTLTELINVLNNVFFRTGRRIAWYGGEKKNGVFIWSDGTSFTKTFWKSGEPNNLNGNENCLLTNDGAWNDEDCSVTKYYVCKLDSGEFLIICCLVLINQFIIQRVFKQRKMIKNGYCSTTEFKIIPA